MIGENLNILSQGQWGFWRVAFLESMPPCRQLTFDFGAVAANASIAKAVPTILRLDDRHLIQIRFAPLDDCEVVLWETAGQAKFAIKTVQARVSLTTRGIDPYYATTEFYVLGKERDPNVEIFNRTAYAMTQTRVKFWGYRYLLEPLQKQPDYFTQIVAEGRSG
jgi:hypothetical protein